MNGASILTHSLARQGVSVMFGVVGIPIIEVGMAAPEAGIQYIGMRNEQAASYAAGAIGYMSQIPGCCLVVSGPGVVHGVAGLANAWANCWPMIMIGGSNSREQNGKGAFQEAPQLETCRPYVKYMARPESIERIPFYVEQAVRMSIQGRPGPVYLDISADLVTAFGEVQFPPRTPDAHAMFAPPNLIIQTLETLQNASFPLVIVGKGAAYGRAEKEVNQFIEKTQLPFLPTPMGKGVVPDDHPLSAAAARSLALRKADVVLLIGARLNWILHFGEIPRFRKDVKFIHIDICPEEIGNNVPAFISLVGDAKSVMSQLNEFIKNQPWENKRMIQWKKDLVHKVDENAKKTNLLMADNSVPMSYYRVFRDIKQVLPKDCIIVGEGANTMDIGRTIMPNFFPRHRLDAGTFGTMGVGLGFAIAAAIHHPEKQIVVVQGDSAFGFSAMETEVICRYKLKITIIVVNNGGIYQGVSELPEDLQEAPPTALMPNARYERIITAFGGNGYYVNKPQDLLPSLQSALQKTPSVVNVIIDPSGERKPQEFEWLTRSKM